MASRTYKIHNTTHAHTRTQQTHTPHTQTPPTHAHAHIHTLAHTHTLVPHLVIVHIIDGDLARRLACERQEQAQVWRLAVCTLQRRGVLHVLREHLCRFEHRVRLCCSVLYRQSIRLEVALEEQVLCGGRERRKGERSVTGAQVCLRAIVCVSASRARVCVCARARARESE